jgi:hypothetical protein
MISTTIVLFGLPITLRYQVHPSRYIEWWLDVDVQDMSAHDELLELLLRKFCPSMITKILEDEHQAHVYEEDAKAAARAEDYNPF